MEKYLDEVERDEEQIRDENIRNFLRSQRAMDSFTADFSHGSGFANCAILPRHKYLSNCGKLQPGCKLFQDNGLNFYLTQDEFYFKENGCARPILDFCVDSPEDLNPQYWKRYIFIWPIGVMHYNIDAKPPRKRLVKPPSEAVSEVISESP